MLLAQKSVVCLKRVDRALELLYVGLLAFSRVLGRETVPGLTSFKTGLTLLVACLSAAAGVGGL